MEERIRQEMSNIIWSVDAPAEKEKNATPKRNVLKRGNKDWVKHLPEDQQYTPDDVFCVLSANKIGRFKEYGKKEGLIWLTMYKKDSFDIMSREWSMPLTNCELVERNGVILNPDKYYKDEKGYHIK